MFKIAKLLLLMACIDYAAYAQDSSAKLFRDASHCLVTERQDWLAVQKADTKSLEFGFVIDTKSDPGVNHIYVVVYTNPDRSKGRVFDLRYQQRASGTLLDVQNNASFVRSGKGIVFCRSASGWHMDTSASSVRNQAGRARSHTTFNLADLTAQFPGVSCKSYVGDK